MLEPGKLSGQTLSDHEFITFQYFSQNLSICHNFSNFQLAQYWPRITLEPIQEYALRVNTTHKNAQERPGTSRGSPGTSAQRPLTSHKNHNFINPASDTIRLRFPLLLMLISITETSSEHDFWYSSRENYQIKRSATTNSVLFKYFRKIHPKVIIFQTFN